MDRDYVLISKNITKMDRLVFIGDYTKDNSIRSIIGFTEDIRKCERFTIEEIERLSIGVYIATDDNTVAEIYSKIHYGENVAISLKKIKSLGYRTKLICVL